jgi:GTP-binding protein
VFIDHAEIKVISGRGGDGSASFRREKYVPRGGPDGGDGGRGGDVIFEVSTDLTTLRDFRYQRVFKAESGHPGSGSGSFGRQGKDLIIPVPQGTMIIDEAGRVLADLTQPNQRYIAARGGRGGRGNIHFATATRQTPDFAERGEPAEEKIIRLELKLLADVGLAGYPNAGKSTFLSRISSARPKIADYPFTTLEPNLGVVDLEGGGFVVADIPGLIEGAHQGVGLGLDFLKHLERTRVIAYVVDVSGMEGRNPADDFRNVRHELNMFSPDLARRNALVIANKMDIPGADVGLELLAEAVGEFGYEVFPISAVTGQGVQEALYHLAELVKNSPAPESPVIEVQPEEPPTSLSDYELRYNAEENIFEASGVALERLVAMTDLSSDDAVLRLQRIFRKIGLEERMKQAGAEQGSLVRIGQTEFELDLSHE